MFGVYLPPLLLFLHMVEIVNIFHILLNLMYNLNKNYILNILLRSENSYFRSQGNYS